jgi:HlyD family secretion protein
MSATAAPARRKRSRRIRWPVLIAAILLVGAVAAGVLLRRNATAGESTVAALETTEAARQDFRQSVSGPGTLAAYRSLDLKPEVSGTITLLPEVGQRVYKGQLIARLDTTTYQRNAENAELSLTKARSQINSLRISQASASASQGQQVSNAQSNVSSAQAALDTARRNLASTESLYAVGGVSAKDLADARSAVSNAEAALATSQVALATVRETSGLQVQSNAQSIADAQLAVRQAELSLQEARDSIAKTKIYAPFSGLVTAVNGTVGQAGGSGTALLTLADDSRMTLPVQVDETEIEKIKVGQRAEVSLDAVADQTFSGTATAVSPSAEVVQNIPVFKVTVTLDNPDRVLKAGMSAEAEIISQEVRNTIVIPKKAVSTVRRRSYVNVLGADGKTEELTLVTTGPDDGTNIVITDGLKPGDLVVLPAKTTTATKTNNQNQRSGLGGIIPGVPGGGFR